MILKCVIASGTEELSLMSLTTVCDVLPKARRSRVKRREVQTCEVNYIGKNGRDRWDGTADRGKRGEGRGKGGTFKD